MSAEAKNMEAIYHARKKHDAGCPGEAQRVLMNPFDVERMGWEDGDNIAGLTLIADPAIVTGMLRVECDLDAAGDGPEVVEAVSKTETPDLVPA
jgi:hypothetical protein